MDRKQFLTILGRNALFAAAAPALESLAVAAPTALDATQRALLTAFADEIIPATDGLLAATAVRHGLHVMTRNTKHFEASGALIIDPWQTT